MPLITPVQHFKRKQMRAKIARSIYARIDRANLQRVAH